MLVCVIRLLRLAALLRQDPVLVSSADRADNSASSYWSCCSKPWKIVNTSGKITFAPRFAKASTLRAVFSTSAATRPSIRMGCLFLSMYGVRYFSVAGHIF